MTALELRFEECRASVGLAVVFIGAFHHRLEPCTKPRLCAQGILQRLIDGVIIEEIDPPVLQRTEIPVRNKAVVMESLGNAARDQICHLLGVLRTVRLSD